jgi:type III secretion protein Q
MMAAQPELMRASDATTASELTPELPAVTAEARDALNAWLAEVGSFHFVNGGREFEWSWTPSSLATMNLAVTVCCGRHEFILALDGLAAIDPYLIGEPFSLLPAALRASVLERLLARFLVMLPASIAESAAVKEMYCTRAALPRASCALGFRLRRLPEHVESSGVLASELPASLTWLREQLRPALRPTAQTQAHLSIPLHVALGTTRVPTHELRALARGDVVWIDTARITRRGVLGVLSTCSGQPLARVTLRHTDLRVSAVARDLPNSSARPATPETPMSVQRLNLDIPVSFELGELRIPLEEIERLEAGHLFDLPADVRAASVELKVAGTRIAEGTLVAIGRRLGVRVTTVTLERAAPLVAASNPAATCD